MSISWSQLQNTLNFVMKHCQKYINSATFIDHVIQCFFHEEIVNNYLGSASFEEALRALEVSESETEVLLM